MSIEVKVKKLHPRAILPTYATDGSGGFDIYALEGTHLIEEIPKVLDTGLSFEIPKDHIMLLFSRSGHGFNQDVRLSNCVGLIDSDYRGEVKVKLHKDMNLESRSTSFDIKPEDRIAQGIVLPIEKVDFKEVEELSNTERGGGGFGSTGR